MHKYDSIFRSIARGFVLFLNKYWYIRAYVYIYI